MILAHHWPGDQWAVVKPELRKAMVLRQRIRRAAGSTRAALLRSAVQGVRPGLTTEERQRLKQLERENFELRPANEILKKAAAFFAQAELDRRAK